MSAARVVLFLSLGACGPPGDPLSPAGEERTAGPADSANAPVLRVDDVDVLPAEVLRTAAWIGVVHPEYTEIHRRRLALTEVVLPRAALRAHAGTAREDTRRRAEAAFAALAGGAEPGSDGVPPAVWTSGDWRVLGIELWGRSRDLAPGEWSGPFEFPGSFALLRLQRSDDLPPPAPVLPPEERSLTLEVVDFPYVMPAELPRGVEDAIAAARLTIVDPAWEEVVPESWKYRMRGEERAR